MKEITIEIPGFTTNTHPDDVLVIGVFGGPGSGKTRFAITAPDPIGVLPLERKTRTTVNNIKQQLDKIVFMPEKDFIRYENPQKLSMMDDAALKRYYRAHVDSIKGAGFNLAAHPDVRTILLDSGTQLYEDMLFATYGRADRIMQRDRGVVNQEYTQFINSLSVKNLIITHHAGDLYKNDKQVPGKQTHKGFVRTGHLCNVMAELKQTGDGFSLSVQLCQDNPMIQGPNGVDLLQDDMISFDYLAQLIDPDWEERTKLAGARRSGKAFRKQLTGKTE